MEKSVKNARLENLEHHRVGSRPQRPVGATWIPHKTQRSVYTLEDDQFLWDCMQPIEQKGQSVGGNKVYQEIAEKVAIYPTQSKLGIALTEFLSLLYRRLLESQT